MRGEMFFSTLADQHDIAQGEQQKWRLLAALEVAMVERLRQELTEHCMSSWIWRRDDSLWQE